MKIGTKLKEEWPLEMIFKKKFFLRPKAQECHTSIFPWPGKKGTLNKPQNVSLWKSQCCWLPGWQLQDTVFSRVWVPEHMCLLINTMLYIKDHFHKTRHSASFIKLMVTCNIPIYLWYIFCSCEELFGLKIQDLKHADPGNRHYEQQYIASSMS